MPAPWPQTKGQLSTAHCAFDVDRVAGRQDVTEFKRRARWQQAWWREGRGLPIGFHTPPAPRAATSNGSRVEFASAKASGCNFLSPKIRTAVEFRLSHPQPDQTLNESRLWSDLLSSMPLCFNLFGDVHGDSARLGAAVDTLWPKHPGAADELLFEWSPGRCDPLYLNNRSAFDVAILLALPNNERGVIGIETKYHEDIRRERPPDPETRMPRYIEVTERSGIFPASWESKVVGTDLQQFWLDHLLVLSMLQHPDARWTWGRFVIVYPSANTSVRDAAMRYRDVLGVDDTFELRTIEDILAAHALHQPIVDKAFRERYLW